MLAIRMQRTGRKGHAMFRMVVQDSRLTPTSGKVVAQLGHYDPHAKTSVIAKDKVEFYLEHGAQPSSRVVRLLKAEGVKLPAWVKTETKKTAAVKHPDKRGNKQPAEVAAELAPTEEVAPSADVVEETTPDREVAQEAPATEEKTEDQAKPEAKKLRK